MDYYKEDVVACKQELVNWIDKFVEYKAENCNGFQSALRFRDAVEDIFKTYLGIEHTKGLMDH